MTLEISDYLLIRIYFARAKNKFDLSGMTKEEARDDFYRTLVMSTQLMQEEDYFLIIPEAMEELDNIVQKYRFDFPGDKEINDEVNFIIGRKKEYEDLSETRLKTRAREWYLSEIKDRLLPRKYRNNDIIVDLLIQDYIYFLKINSSFNIDDYNKNVDFDTLDGTVQVNNIIPFLALINLMFNRFPEYVENNIYINGLFDRLDAIARIDDIPKDCLKYLKTTVKNINKKTKNMDLSMQYEMEKFVAEEYIKTLTN